MVELIQLPDCKWARERLVVGQKYEFVSEAWDGIVIQVSDEAMWLQKSRFAEEFARG